MATMKHWLQAVSGSPTRQNLADETHRHDETAELWSTMSSPRYLNNFMLPAELTRAETSRTTRACDVRPILDYQDFVYNPDCEQMVTAILSVVINRPHLPLPPEYNSTLLYVLESHNSLLRSLKEEKHNTEIDALAMEETLREWERDRKEFRAEIKRLEERIAQLQGVEATVKARQSSMLRKKSYETSDGAIARIRRNGTSKEKSSPDHKLLHQPSKINFSSITLSPPQANNGMELCIGHPPTARDRALLSEYMEWQQVNTKSGASRDEILPTGSSERARTSPAYLQPSSYETDMMDDGPFPSGGFSPGASSVVTAINLKLQSAPVGTTKDGSASSMCGHLSCVESAESSDDESPISCEPPNTQRQRHLRRQFSFTSGDDSGSRPKIPTTPVRQNFQNCSSILGKSLTYDVERSSLAVNPTHVYATTQGCPARRNGSNYSVTLDGRMEIFGPLGRLNGPKVSAVESLERIKASIRKTKGGTGSEHEVDGTTSAAFAQTVTQKDVKVGNDEGHGRLTVKPIKISFEYDYGKEGEGKNPETPNEIGISEEKSSKGSCIRLDSSGLELVTD
ncbi:hypothetical protein GP486_003783 [Trichoglossum hirsutum]|uniref:Uncharacterized protein n=1 Tax=Trichoglossum hirsutum TaxID=265104 RepID=A0A9P8LCE7_9PEZI|nr:hypothetical protein GP486_003783 [Trichoglossum hirsutum]